MQNNCLYRYLGNNVYRNIASGKEGEINEELAQKLFKINIEATVIFNEYPAIEKLINVLNLRFTNIKT